METTVIQSMPLVALIALPQAFSHAFISLRTSSKLIRQVLLYPCNVLIIDTVSLARMLLHQSAISGNNVVENTRFPIDPSDVNRMSIRVIVIAYLNEIPMPIQMREIPKLVTRYFVGTEMRQMHCLFVK